MAETFKLPASSLEEILKIIQAYANAKENAVLSLEDINQSTGVPCTAVSSNNGFLVQIGLITKGNKKSATDIGRNLGRAYISKIDYEIDRIWKEIISENDFLNRMISAVRIRNGMDRTSFLNHIIYSSGQKDTKQNRTGAGAVIDIMKAVGILSEADGKLTVSEATIIERNDDPNLSETQAAIAQPITTNSIPIATLKKENNITINININCSVSEIDDLSEKIHKLLKEISE